MKKSKSIVFAAISGLIIIVIAVILVLIKNEFSSVRFGNAKNIALEYLQVNYPDDNFRFEGIEDANNYPFGDKLPIVIFYSDKMDDYHMVRVSIDDGTVSGSDYSFSLFNYKVSLIVNEWLDEYFNDNKINIKDYMVYSRIYIPQENDHSEYYGEFKTRKEIDNVLKRSDVQIGASIILPYIANFDEQKITDYITKKINQTQYSSNTENGFFFAINILKPENKLEDIKKLHKKNPYFHTSVPSSLLNKGIYINKNGYEPITSPFGDE